MPPKSNEPYQSQRDETLMVAMNMGDLEAFNELYGRYKDRLLYYFYRMLGNSQEKAQDFLQDIFVKVIEKPELFDPNRRFSTWIFSIAHNMCKNEYRSLKVREIMSHTDNMEMYSQISDDRIDEHQLLAESVFVEIDKLEEPEKSAFLLRYREGFSVKEISQMLDIPEGTVKSKLFYVRKQLVETLSIENV